jgi:hypothetical protein
MRTLPWICLIAKLDFFVEFEHLGGCNDQALLWFIVLDLVMR